MNVLDREQLFEHMAQCCAMHLTLDQCQTVANVAMTQSERFHAYLVLDGGPFTPEQFAAHALRCAMHVLAGALMTHSRQHRRAN